MFHLFKRPISSRWVILAVSLFWLITANQAFFRHVVQVYPLTWENLPAIASLAVLLVGVTVLLLTLLSNRWILKPLLITLLMVTSSVAYFIDTYDIVINTEMITNVVQTNVNESADLLSWTMALYILVLGVLPSLVVYRLNIVYPRIGKQLIEDGKTIGVTLAAVLALVFAFSKFYTSFFREHKPLRYYANPSYYLYSLGKYTSDAFSARNMPFKLLGEDARNDPADTDRELIILVVGEAVRVDHFALNGYTRDTNPLLSREKIINFPDVSSCGTETAVSVPCMFSHLGREEYDKDEAASTENVLDILSRAGVNVLWRDNNSDSKGVAKRLAYEDFKSPDTNPVCDVECRDEGMLAGLDEYIKAHPKGDILIVLHQMGNHGPAYYKRYPKEFEKFTPVCRSNQLQECSREEIVNAYDNTLLYTDHVLSQVISLLKKHDDTFETAMFYMSDHGESLGENGLYLHGFPYAIAPDAQKKVPAVMWFGNRFRIDRDQLAQKAAQPYTHDHLFHTLLNLFEVKTSVYRPELDMLNGMRK